MSRRVKTLSSVKDMGEAEIVRMVACYAARSQRGKANVALINIGDDAAVVNKFDARVCLKVDQLVEGVHYQKNENFQRVGHKALARPLSDFAAMGAVPRYALLSMGLPEIMKVEKLKEFLNGFLRSARRWDVRLVGGETGRTTGGAFFSVTVVGEFVRGTKPLTRSGARPGDLIAVTGKLGGSLLGRHLTFSPRLREGKFCAGRREVTAAMDLSDGLGVDLPRMAKASGLAARIDCSKIPVHAHARRISQQDNRTPVVHAITDGEDYELLLAIRKPGISGFRKEWKRRTQLELTVIGEWVKEKAGVIWRDLPDGAKKLPAYEHFR